MQPELHKTETARENLQKSETPILRDIGNQLSMLEQNAPQPWQQFFKSMLSSKNITVEILAKQLNRKGEVEKLDSMYDLLIYASHADYSANDNFEVLANELVNKIVQLAA